MNARNENEIYGKMQCWIFYSHRQQHIGNFFKENQVWKCRDNLLKYIFFIVRSISFISTVNFYSHFYPLCSLNSSRTESIHNFNSCNFCIQNYSFYFYFSSAYMHINYLTLKLSFHYCYYVFHLSVSWGLFWCYVKGFCYDVHLKLSLMTHFLTEESFC